MKKVLTLLLLFLVIKASSQSGFPPAYQIRTDTILNVDLPNTYWQVLEDKTGQLNLNQVQRQPADDSFHFAKTTLLNPDIHTFWYRYTLKNAMDHQARISLASNSEQSTFYIGRSDGKFAAYENGEATPWRRQAGYNLLKLIPLVLKPGEEIIIYNRIHNSYSFYYFTDDVSVSYGSTVANLHNYATNDSLYVTNVHDSILFGILVFAALFNFFFFLVVREKVYLYFSIYLLCLGGGRMGNEFYYVFFREFRTTLSYLMPLVFLLTFSSLTYFIRSLLNSKRFLPQWDKFLVIFNAIYFVVGLVLTCLGLHYYRVFTQFDYLFKIGLIVCNLLTFFLLVGKQKKTDWKLIGAVVPGFLIWGIGYSIVSLYQVYDYKLLGNFTAWLNSWWYVIETICLSWLVIFFSWILLQRFGRLQKQIVQQALEKEQEKNQLIIQQKIDLEKEVEARTAELKHSLIQLKNTQNQLIQSEKMASMGELTAGIAHEIQNPLNFVNNFSEVSVDLTGELREEILNGNTAEAMAITNELAESLSKIHHHGKRAESIVKGMLQHSRTSTGERQATNMNALADEFLRLSFHGLRAKDKSFNAFFSTHFAQDLPKIEVVQQDMGRVMLNLFNNAFYAVNQKQKIAGPDYKPEVSVWTFAEDSKLVIKIKDNGTGIPEHIKSKIMQPFFTTKPTGEGTGLGLSITYDMVVKGYGGEISINTQEGEFTEFIVQLPLNHLSNQNTLAVTSENE